MQKFSRNLVRLAVAAIFVTFAAVLALVAKLQKENGLLREQLALKISQTEPPSEPTAALPSAPPTDDEQVRELLCLRAEITALVERTKGLEELLTEATNRVQETNALLRIESPTGDFVELLALWPRNVRQIPVGTPLCIMVRCSLRRTPGAMFRIRGFYQGEPAALRKVSTTFGYLPHLEARHLSFMFPGGAFADSITSDIEQEIDRLEFSLLDTQGNTLGTDSLKLNLSWRKEE